MKAKGDFLKTLSTQLYISDMLIMGYSKRESLAPISHCPVEIAVE